MGKRAFITGITGQDGAYLARLLLGQGYAVAGGARRIADDALWRLRELGVRDRVCLVAFDMRDAGGVKATLHALRPDEIYNFAAQSLVSESFAHPAETAAINAGAWRTSSRRCSRSCRKRASIRRRARRCSAARSRLRRTSGRRSIR